MVKGLEGLISVWEYFQEKVETQVSQLIFSALIMI